MEEINIKDFLDYLKKYIILIIFITVLLVSGMFAYDKMVKKPMYTTYTTIVLVKGENNGLTGTNEAISQNDVLLNQNLVSTYSQIIKSKLVLKQVISDLKLDYSIKQLSSNIKVEALEDTEILKISVSDLKPERAADIANKIADVFSLEIKKIYKINNVSVIDDAQVSYEVSNNTLKRDIALAILAGIFGTSALVFIKFYFDDTVKYSESLEQEIKMPIIAKVLREKNSTDLITVKRPNALTSESIRTLRTNLQFASVDKEIKTILLTSTLPGEGKSFIAANLAVSFAQAGKLVLLVDCDLRKGRQHKIFGIPNQKGLSNLLIGDFGKVKDYIHKTKIKGLSVITRGACPPNPSELLNSKKNSVFIGKVRDWYDVVIFDGAPCSGLSDSLILSSFVDGVVMVTSENTTPKSELNNSRKSITAVGGNIVGGVINNMNNKGSSYGKYYYYYEDDE
ncbi:MAG: polysaccharide biosynthesis tyrosine autokinase [Bacilli bacterium]|nr:polysaccharide biosynthesis tyrosine autokinase [Bacilli bacterium]